MLEKPIILTTITMFKTWYHLIKFEHNIQIYNYLKILIKNYNMKIIKISLCLVIIMLAFSCKKEEIGITANSAGLLLKQVMVDNQAVLEYTYNSSRLMSAEKSKFDLTNYNYTGNQLTGTDYYINFNILSSDAQVSSTAMNQVALVAADNTNKGGSGSFEYNGSDQLVKATYASVTGSSQHSEFIYGADGRISRQILYWDNVETGHIDYTYDANGNLTKENLYNISASGTNELSTTTDYEYDNSTNPYKAISRIPIPGLYTNTNNITKETYTIDVNSEQGTGSVQVIVNTYVYNAKGYPISKNGNVTYSYI
jgi:hypothetical protein